MRKKTKLNSLSKTINIMAMILTGVTGTINLNLYGFKASVMIMYILMLLNAVCYYFNDITTSESN